MAYYESANMSPRTATAYDPPRTAQQDATPETPMSAALTALVNNIAELEQQIQSLTHKLQPVTTPTPQGKEASGGSTPAPPRASVLNVLDESISRISAIGYHVNELRNNIVV